MRRAIRPVSGASEPRDRGEDETSCRLRLARRARAQRVRSARKARGWAARATEALAAVRARSLRPRAAAARASLFGTSAQEHTALDRVWLVYDGECPMCSNYAMHLRLRQAVGEFVLVDARGGGPIVDEVRGLPHDPNDAMAVKVGERWCIGAEALNVLALLSAERGAFSKLNRRAFSSPLASRFAYPLLKAGRRVLLKLKGAGPITHDG